MKKAGVIIAATMAATPAQAWWDPFKPRDGSVLLDNGGHGAGQLCPKEPKAYLDGLVGTLDEVGADTGLCEWVKDSEGNGKQTSGGTGKVYKCDVPGNQNGATTFVFQSKFGQGDKKLTAPQVDLLDSLYDERNQFSPLLDPTYIPGAFKVVPTRYPTKQLLGHDDDIESALQRTEFKFIDAVPIFDRDLVFMKLEKQIQTDGGKKRCTVLGNPSVSNGWIYTPGWAAGLRDLGAYVFANLQGFNIRAQNLYPSGDRLCVTEVESGMYEATLEHMITTDIGGIIGASGLYDASFFGTGLFDEQQADAYLTEAQLLEDGLHTGGRTLKSPEKVVSGPGNAASESVSRDAWMETEEERVAIQETLSSAMNEGSLPAGLTATRCDANVDAFGSLYVACSCAGQAQGLDKKLFREGMAAVLNVSADRIDGITSSPQGETLVVRFLVGSVGYKAQVDAPASCAERWAVLAGLVVTVLLLAFAAALRAGVLSFRGQSPQAEAGKSVVEVENVGPATEMEKTVPGISADAECAATETQGESA